MNKPKQLIIIGGGYSIKPAITNGLWNKLKGRFVFGLNYVYRYFNSTVNCCVDKNFYEKESKLLNFQNLSLIISNQHQGINYLPNSIIMKGTNNYDSTLCKGIYKPALAGLFSTTLGVYLMKQGQIFLLGFDSGGQKERTGRYIPDSIGNKITHWYQGDFNHRGISKTNYYEIEGKSDSDWEVYKAVKNVEIYNVSLESNINVFPKISYSQFYEMLNNEELNQEELRRWVKEELISKTVN